MIKRILLVACLMLWSLSSQAIEPPTVRLATTDWPPYVGQDLKGMGYIYTIVDEAFQRGGYKTIVQFMPWTEVKLLQKYQNHALFPVYDGELNTDYACSDSIYGGPVGLYKRKQSIIHYTVAHPEDHQEEAFLGLSRYRFGVVKSYKNVDALDKAAYLQKTTVANDYENLLQLSNGDVDLIFIDIFVAEYLISQYPQFKNLEFMGPSLANMSLRVCFSKEDATYAEKLAAFNQGLRELNDEGAVNRIMNAYNF